MKSLITRSSLFSLLSLLVIAVITSSCGSTEIVDDYIEPELTHTLKKIGEYQIPIDSITPANFSHYQYIENNNHEFFTFLNPIDQNINFYDLETQEIAFKVPLAYQGPNSVGKLSGFNSGYHIHNLDSIFILNRSSGAFYLINKNSERLFTYSFMREKTQPTAILPSSAPMIINKTEAILSNIPAEIKFSKKNKNFISEYATSYNLDNQSIQYNLSYPEIFSYGAWPMDMFKISWSNNPEKKQIIVSYTLDNYVYVYDYDFNLISKHVAQSSLKSVNRSIRKKEMTSKIEARKYFWSQSKYNKVYFDPYRNIYIRECIESISDQELIKMDAGLRPKFKRSLVILDEGFNKIAEVIEPFNEELKIFFAKDGIYRWIENINENEIKFYKYKLTKI